MKIDLDPDQDEEGDAAMGVYGVLVAIQRILESPLQVDVYPKLFDILQPIIHFCFDPAGCDYLEECGPILEIFVDRISPLQNKQWFYFPVLMYMLSGNPTGKDP